MTARLFDHAVQKWSNRVRQALATFSPKISYRGGGISQGRVTQRGRDGDVQAGAQRIQRMCNHWR